MTQQVNNTSWNPTNERLAELTGLPNLDNITDTNRLSTLADIADNKSALQSNAGQRAEAFALYADRAEDKSDE